MRNTLTMPPLKRILPRSLPGLPQRLFSKTIRRLRVEIPRSRAACAAALSLASCTFAIAVQNPPPKPPPPPPLVLAGGTVIDVTDWCRSANDIQHAIVFIRDGRILAAGTRPS